MSRDTLHSRQAEWEKTLFRRALRLRYCYIMDRIVLFFGKDRSPEDVFRSEIPLLKAHLKEKYGLNSAISLAQYIAVGTAFYNWLDAMEYVPIGFNPFRPFYARQHRKNIERKEEELVTTK